MSDFIINLPYPPSGLSPNARNHWAALSKTKKLYRSECRMLTASARNKFNFDADRKPRVVIEFYPPDKRKRDRDNMVAAFKAGQDGVADAIGVDDYNWVSSYSFGEPVKGGRVTVRFKKGDNNE